MADGFATVRAAKEFVVAKMEEEARRRSISLSDVERKMLHFSENYDSLPDIAEVADRFDQEYDDNRYEAKMSSLLRNAFERDRKESPASLVSWREAVRRIQSEDHYLGVLLDQAGVRGSSEWLRAFRWIVAIILVVLGGLAIVHAWLWLQKTPPLPSHYVAIGFFGIIILLWVMSRTRTFDDILEWVAHAIGRWFGTIWGREVFGLKADATTSGAAGTSQRLGRGSSSGQSRASG